MATVRWGRSGWSRGTSALRPLCSAGSVLRSLGRASELGFSFFATG